MMRSNAVTVLAACSCLLISRSAAAQAVPPAPGPLVPADTALTRPAQLGQPFPYARGVSVELGLYRRVRGEALRADTLLAGKNRALDALAAQLRTAQLRYANCAASLQESTAAGVRQQAAIARLLAELGALDRLHRRAAAWAPFTPATGLALLGGLVLGVFAARH